MRFSKLTFLVFFLFSQALLAKYQSIDAIIAHASKNGTSLVKLLEDISLKPTGRVIENKDLMKVTRVSKGSVYDKKGITAGDFVTRKIKNVKTKNHKKLQTK